MSYTSFGITTAPSSTPISVAEAKTQIRVDTSDDDTIIGNYISAAVSLLERMTRRAFITQTITLKYDSFPSEFRLPRAPAQSVTSIQYVDTDGATQTWGAGNYSVDTSREPASIVPAYNIDYPDTRPIPNAVTVVYVAGYGGSSDVPEEIRLMIRLLVGHFYENREATGITRLHELPLGLQMMVASYEMPEVF